MVTTVWMQAEFQWWVHGLVFGARGCKPSRSPPFLVLRAAPAYPAQALRFRAESFQRKDIV